MKVLTIRQPWASMIFQLGKDIENREWYTFYRGRFLVHAAAKIDRGGYEFMAEHGLVLSGPTPLGAIIGSVDLVDVVSESKPRPEIYSKWFCGRYGFLLRDPIACEPIPMKGQLGFWETNVNR